MEKLHVKEKATTKITKKYITKMTITEEIRNDFKGLWIYARYDDGK